MTLAEQIKQAADTFVLTVLEALRNASLQDIVALSGARTAPRRARIRRTEQDIQAAVKRIVAALGQADGGMRVEELARTLGVPSRTLTQPLKEARASGIIKSRGQRRATTYYLAKKNGH